MTHTPGPWHLSERRDPHSGSPVYSVLAGAHLWLADVLGAECEAGEANARLIAAAPELLEACRSCLHQIGTDSDLDDVVSRPDKYDELEQMLRDVIDKAAAH